MRAPWTTYTTFRTLFSLGFTHDGMRQLIERLWNSGDARLGYIIHAVVVAHVPHGERLRYIDIDKGTESGVWVLNTTVADGATYLDCSHFEVRLGNGGTINVRFDNEASNVIETFLYHMFGEGTTFFTPWRDIVLETTLSMYYWTDYFEELMRPKGGKAVITRHIRNY